MPKSKYKIVSVKGLAKDPEVQKMPPVMRAIYSTHLRDILQRDHENELTPREFLTLSFGKCYYCGTNPENMTKSETSENIAYNGIDRIDNNLGYVYGNVVTCCKDCNSMKSNLNEDRFLEHAKKISAYQASISEEEQAARIETRKQDKEKSKVKPPEEPKSLFEMFGDQS